MVSFRFIQVSWSNPNPNKNSGKIFIYRSIAPFTVNTLPEPLVIINDPSFNYYDDYSVSEGTQYYYMVAYREFDQSVFTPVQQILYTLPNAEPTNLIVNVVNGEYQLSWEYTRFIDDGFIYYKSDRPFDESNLPEPIATGIIVTNYVDSDTSDLVPSYIRIGIQKDEQIYLSDQVVIGSNYAYQVEANLDANGLYIQWQHTEADTAQYNVYISDEPILESALPAPVTVTNDQFYLKENPDKKTYIRIGTLISGVEYLSTETVFHTVPYDVTVAPDNNMIVVNWKSDHAYVERIDYLVSGTPMDPDNLPDPMPVTLFEAPYFDYENPFNQSMYVRLVFTVWGEQYVSDEVHYIYDRPHSLVSSEEQFSLAVSWEMATSDYDSFNYYVSENILDLDDMPAPSMTGITDLSLIDTETLPFFKKYIRIGVVKDGVEKLSEQFIHRYDEPYSVQAGNFNDQFGVIWAADDRQGVTYNAYISEDPITLSALPEPVATNLTTGIYTDASIDLKTRQYVCVAAVRAGVPYYSDIFEYGYIAPKNVSAVRGTDIQVEWQYDRVIPTGAEHGFNYYCEDAPIDINALPAPKATNIHTLNYTDSTTDPIAEKHILISVRRAGREYFSDPIVI